MSENKIQLLKKLVDEHFNNIEYLTLQINESQIAIVCHCSPSNLNKKHQQLYYINIKDKKIIKNIGNGIKYIDKDSSCPNDKWDNIIEPLMYIWGINCPIYTSYTNNNIIKDILNNSFNKLKINGKVLFGYNFLKYDLSSNKSMINQINDNTKYFQENPFPGFDFKTVLINDLSNELSYIIGKEDHEKYYVFTKNTNKKIEI